MVKDTRVRPIENPEWLPDKPKRFKDAKWLWRGHSTGFGLPIEIFELPHTSEGKGRVVVVDHQLPAISRYAVYSSLRAWEIHDRQQPTRDPEANGGRFFPTDYPRLKITQKHVRSEVSATGWQHAPACECQGCGELVGFYAAKYAHSEARGYLPFCEGCYNAHQWHFEEKS